MSTARRVGFFILVFGLVIVQYNRVAIWLDLGAVVHSVA
jgi:hypothetical protein